MMVHQCFAMKFRHGTGMTHLNPNHGPLSDKRDPPSQFAGYGPVCKTGHGVEQLSGLALYDKIWMAAALRAGM